MKQKIDFHYLMKLAPLLFKGKFEIEHYDRQGKLLDKQTCPNGITNVGKNYILDTMFNNQTQIAQSAWCIGLIDNAGGPVLSASDTMSSHAGWTELTAYTESTRVAWGSGSSSGQSTTNATPATFDMNATNTVYGIFINSNNTKGGTSGTLWSTAAFSSTVPVNNGSIEPPQLAMAA